MKQFCFRFDIDTYLCMRDGVPNLVELGDRIGASFTFFANMGKGVDRAETIRKALNRGKQSGPSGESCEKLSNLTKLGHLGYLVTALANPSVGRYARDSLRRAVERGHEVGLHGGLNHGSWQSRGAGWETDDLRREVEFGLAQLKEYGIQDVTSFSSPGWQGSIALHDVLVELGFDLIADEHGHELDQMGRLGKDGSLRSVPTNLTGEPGGVGYIEHLRALGMDDEAAINKFRTDLISHKEFAVVYDHPYFAGRRELDLVEKIVLAARDCGYRIATMAEIAEQLDGSGEQ